MMLRPGTGAPQRCGLMILKTLHSDLENIRDWINWVVFRKP
jgi:hypothetical protein